MPQHLRHDTRQVAPRDSRYAVKLPGEQVNSVCCAAVTAPEGPDNPVRRCTQSSAVQPRYSGILAGGRSTAIQARLLAHFCRSHHPERACGGFSNDVRSLIRRLELEVFLITPAWDAYRELLSNDLGKALQPLLELKTSVHVTICVCHKYR
jgi:hypothetical protein